MAAPKTQAKAPLDELMMAMDVVDTLRHEERVVARELGQDDRDEALKARLRKIYEGQGLEVTERILDEGIAALRESRFVYKPPRPSWETWLAKVWVRRWRYAPWAGGSAVLLVGWVVWAAWSGGADERLAERIGTMASEVSLLAETPDARTAIATLADRGQRAAAAGQTSDAEATLTRLEALKTEIQAAFEVRIVSRPGVPSGVFRVPDVNQRARNYYLIVEAIAPGGTALPRTVLNEETGETKSVTIWGQRVPKALFDRIAADKQADGIVDAAVLGRKTPGQIEIDWATGLPGGAITEW
ncbi:MAG: DUF6384 family protein [Pseudomonadota bacterium]